MLNSVYIINEILHAYMYEYTMQEEFTAKTKNLNYVIFLHAIYSNLFLLFLFLSLYGDNVLRTYCLCS
jgi:hypothetical protein